MPTLPSVVNFDRSTPTSSRGITGLNNDQVARAETQTGQAISNIGRGIDQLGAEFQKEQLRLDSLRAEDAVNKLSQKSMDLAYGEKGFMRLKGGDVVNRPILDEYPELLNQEYERVSSGLANDQQRELFKRSYGNMANKFKAEILNHSFKESERYADDVLSGTINRLETQATQEFSSNFDIQNSKQGIADATRKRLAEKGLDEDSINAAVASQISDFNAKVINARSLNGDLKGAMDYYRENKEGIDLKARGSLEKMLKEGAEMDLAQGAGDYVISQGMNEAQALEYVRTKYSGSEEVAAVTEVKTRYAEQSTIKARQEKAVSDQAWGVISNGGSVKQIPLDIWNALDGREKVQIQDYMYNKAERAKRDAEGKAVKTDIISYAGLRDDITSNPQEWTNSELIKDPRFFRLSNADQQEMIKFGDALRNDPNKVKETLSVGEQINGTMFPIITDKTKRQVASMKIQQDIDDEALARGKPLNRKERQDIIDRNLLDGEVLSGKWYLPDRNVKLYQVTGTKDEEKFMPSDDSIINRFEKRNGRKPTSDELSSIKERLKGK